MACPESSSGIFRRAPGKETEEDTMSIAQGRYERWDACSILHRRR